jgi:hypothetical protein
MVINTVSPLCFSQRPRLWRGKGAKEKLFLAPLRLLCPASGGMKQENLKGHAEIIFIVLYYPHLLPMQ